MIDQALIELLRPLVRELVETEIERAKLQWRWLSVRQAAGLLDVSEEAIYSRIKRDQLPYRKVEGRIYIDMERLGEKIRKAG